MHRSEIYDAVKKLYEAFNDSDLLQHDYVARQLQKLLLDIGDTFSIAPTSKRVRDRRRVERAKQRLRDTLRRLAKSFKLHTQAAQRSSLSLLLTAAAAVAVSDAELLDKESCTHDLLPLHPVAISTTHDLDAAPLLLHHTSVAMSTTHPKTLVPAATTEGQGHQCV